MSRTGAILSRRVSGSLSLSSFRVKIGMRHLTLDRRSELWSLLRLKPFPVPLSLLNFVFFLRLKSKGLTTPKTRTEKVVSSEFALDLDFYCKFVECCVASLAELLTESALLRKDPSLRIVRIKVIVVEETNLLLRRSRVLKMQLIQL